MQVAAQACGHARGLGQWRGAVWWAVWCSATQMPCSKAWGEVARREGVPSGAVRGSPRAAQAEDCWAPPCRKAAASHSAVTVRVCHIGMCFASPPTSTGRLSGPTVSAYPKSSPACEDMANSSDGDTCRNCSLPYALAQRAAASRLVSSTRLWPEASRARSACPGERTKKSPALRASSPASSPDAGGSPWASAPSASSEASRASMRRVASHVRS
mmetsp:Transcript_75414/g.224820  ORF Transcript_75414/g.224820 Transcript_75414/m.224820 type:complete len:214 (+) Transcript_75414:169-810(+)